MTMSVLQTPERLEARNYTVSVVVVAVVAGGCLGCDAGLMCRF